MRFKIRQIAFLCILLFCSDIGEKIIPHSHKEIEGIVIPDFSTLPDSTSNSNDGNKGESIHANLYLISEGNTLSSSIVSELGILWSNVTIKSKPGILIARLSNYNKTADLLLYIIRNYSSKSPPFNN